MDTYSPLLERTRLPQPSLQKLAVVSIFDKLRSSPPHSGPDSDRGRSAITQCLHSNSPAVVDQSVRELCLLVKDSKLELSSGLMEFQSALEGTNSRFVNVFVKAIGFLVRLGFQNDVDSFRFGSSEAHPFVKILSCRVEVQSELVHQVLIFIMQNKHLGLVAVCEFLKPFINYSVIRMPSSPIMSTFAIKLLSSMASLCCAFPKEALPVFKLLMECFKYFPVNNAEELTNITYIMEYTVDVFTVVLKNLVQSGSLIHETQLCGMELLGIILSLGSHLQKRYGESESIFEVSRRLLIVQGELGLSYISTVSSVMRSLFVGLIQSELEHVQLSILKLLLFLLEWKSAYENVHPSCELHEELLFILPLINLISSPAKSVKELATELLLILGKLIVNVTVAPKSELLVQDGFPCSSKPEDIIFRFLQRLWFQDQTSLSGSFYIHWLSDGGNNSKEKLKVAESWTTLIMDYSQGIMGKQKLSLPISRSEEIFLHEMPPLLSAIAGVLVVHHTLWNSAIDLLAVTGNMDPKLGVPLFLLILFYSNVFSGKFKEIYFHDILLKLLGMLPSLSSHPAMIPLVVQTILPMLQKDAKPELYATAMRLLCKTWEINDRIFGSLQGLLLPKGFREFTCDRNICISMAVSVRDVCRRNPDRGVDLILSVEDCIESKDPIIQALGLQSLGHLCEADVVDFYTAWGVIAKHVLNYSRNPVVADSLCLLLRWGAMDAEVNPEAAMNVLQILWEVGTSTHAGQASLWANARASSFEALTCYEVPHIQQLIPGFRAKNMEVLISETDPKVLGAMEKFEAKIITHEHITRRRLVKEKRVPTNKIEKLLDVFPRVIGISGNNSKAGELPGAALFCLSFSIKEDNNQGASKVLQNLHDRYGNALLEIAGSLQLSRNMLIALLALQSWKPFLRRWLKACIILLDAKASSSSLDTLSKAAEDILKCIRRKAEDSIPRSAENIALAVGAFCTVLPPSAHAVKSAASKFLLNWLFQYEHEYRQWSAAISLGVVSSCLHVTDHKQKFQGINALIEVAATSKSTLVKGACGVGLGFSCQVFLTTPELEDDSQLDKNMYRLQEIDLLGRIIWTLSQLIGHFAQSSSAVLENISKYFPHSTGNANQDIPLNMLGENGEYLEEDIWGITGLVLGLGCSVTAIYRSGCADAVLEIKNIITSWIPHVNPLAQNSGISDKGEIVLSVGSCLVLPFVVALCQRVELIDGAELDLLAVSYRELIDELSSVKKSGALHQSLLMASCVGVGNLLSCILNEGLHSMDVKFVKDLLGRFKKIYSSPYPPLIHLGGMLGVVNTLGAGAGTLFLHHSLPSPRSSYDYKESSYIMGPLLSSAVMEPILTLSIQEIFLVAQNSDDCQMQQYAAWAVSFLRHSLFSRQLPKEDSDFQKDTTRTKSVPQSFPEDSLVMELCLWLMNLNHSAIGATPNVNTIAASLRCLSHAPRLPQLDWGPIIRKCMRYKDQTAVILLKDCGSEKVNLREECLSFTLVHAKNFDSLLTFLDELSDLSRFKMLEINLQLYLLLHLSDLLKIFSGSRLEKLFDDISSFINSLVSPEQTYNTEQKSLLRTSCWTGLYMCLETSVESQECISNLENCMEVLFSLAPEGLYSRLALENKNYLMEEQHEAIRCLGKARRDWLSDLLLVSEVNLREQGPQFSEAKKKIQATARLVGFGSVALIELAKLKPYILNIKSEVIWDVLVEVTAALNHAEGTVRRKWLVEAVEISCVTSYPSTALRFIGLLCGSFSKYMPLLIVDPTTVLCDLPVTLPSLLLDDSSWGLVVETVVSHLFTSTERIYNWVVCTTRAVDPPSQHLPDDSEEINAVMLLNVMHHTCLNLKDHLPPEKLLRLSNMVIPEYIVS